MQTLFAESLMDLHPWRLWSIDGKPGPDTVETVTTLETVLKKDPNHIGANHYYIHAVEVSPDPSRAMASADRLGKLAPGAGHLVHMPSHIYVRTGRFHDAAEVNANAIKADNAFLAKTNEGGVYPLMYYTHNIHFLCYAEMIEGRKRDALTSARLLETKVPLDAVRAMPMAEFWSRCRTSSKSVSTCGMKSSRSPSLPQICRSPARCGITRARSRSAQREIARRPRTSKGSSKR